MNVPKRIKYKGQIYEAIDDIGFKFKSKPATLYDKIEQYGVDKLKHSKNGFVYIDYAYGNKDYYFTFGRHGKYNLLLDRLNNAKDLIFSNPYDAYDVDDGWLEYIAPYSNKPIEELANEIIDKDDESRFISNANERVNLGDGIFAYRAN